MGDLCSTVLACQWRPNLGICQKFCSLSNGQKMAIALAASTLYKAIEQCHYDVVHSSRCFLGSSLSSCLLTNLTLNLEMFIFKTLLTVI